MSDTMQSSLTTLRVLEIVGERQPIAVAEVAKLIDRPKSSTQRALQTLHEAGWIRPDGSERTRWLLTARAAVVAGQVANENGLRDASGPVMRRLRDETLESVSLAVLDGDEAVSVDFCEGRHTLRLVPPIGVRMPLHAGGSGRVILAHLPANTQDRITSGPLVRLTPNTITSRRRLLADLAEIRRNGYAISREEVTEGAAGVAAVILDPEGSPVASLGLLLPVHRAESDRQIRPLAASVRAAAAAIESALKENR